MTLTNIIQKITYPLFYNIYNNKKKINNTYLNTLKITNIIIFPILLKINLISKPLISILLKNK